MSFRDNLSGCLYVFFSVDQFVNHAGRTVRCHFTTISCPCRQDDKGSSSMLLSLYFLLWYVVKEKLYCVLFPLYPYMIVYLFVLQEWIRCSIVDRNSCTERFSWKKWRNTTTHFTTLNLSQHHFHLKQWNIYFFEIWVSALWFLRRTL